jgi:hypothetical protein
MNFNYRYGHTGKASGHKEGVSRGNFRTGGERRLRREVLLGSGEIRTSTEPVPTARCASLREKRCGQYGKQWQIPYLRWFLSDPFKACPPCPFVLFMLKLPTCVVEGINCTIYCTV